MFNWLWDSVAFLLKLVGFSFDEDAFIGPMLHFFIADVIQIIILLSIMVLIIGYVRSYFPPERTRRILDKIKGIKSNFTASLFGSISPFCSCSSVPIFIGLVTSGVPLGVTFSFLITSPMVNQAAVLLLISDPAFSFSLVVVFVVFGLLVGTFGGYIIGKLKLEHHVEGFVYDIKMPLLEEEKLSQKDRLIFAKNEVVDILKRVYKWIIIGVLIGAFIHNWVPSEVILNMAGPNNPFAVVIVTVISVPLYVNILGTIPIAQALISQGMAVGTAISFMMATTALSIPQMIIIRKVIKPKLLVVFVSVTAVGIILIGYIINFIYYVIL